MCYWSYGLHDKYGEEEYGYYISHSAIIQSIESGFNVTLPSTFNKINLISKRGDWGLYTHKGDGTPYTEQEADFCYAKIYRPKSNASYVLSQSNLTFDESCYANGNSSVIIDKYEMYKINVNYSHNYQMIISSIYPVSVRMYDKHMQLMIDNPDNNYSNSSYSVIINPYLANGDIYYLRVSYQNSYNTGTIITHMHNYSYDYVWINYMRHNAICSCESVHSEMHIASGTPISPGSPYSECILCGGLVPITINAPEYGTNR